MKKYFNLNLRGGDWSRPFIGFWILYLALNIPLQTSSRSESFVTGNTVAYSILSVSCGLALIVVQAIFTIVFLRILMPKLTIGGKTFAFRGSIGRFLKINIGGFLLTIITVTIYAPWFAKRVVGYLLSETSFDGGNPEFTGKAGELLKYLLLAFWLPIIVSAVLFALTVGINAADIGTVGAANLWTTLLAFVIFLLLVPFFYLAYRWYVNIRWNDVTIAWHTSFWPSCGFIVEQLLLTIVTLGIYWPAVCLKLYGYFMERTMLSRGDIIIGRPLCVNIDDASL